MTVTSSALTHAAAGRHTDDPVAAAHRPRAGIAITDQPLRAMTAGTRGRDTIAAVAGLSQRRRGQ